MHVTNHFMMMALFLLWTQQVSTTRQMSPQMSLANRHLKIGAQAWPPLLVIEKTDSGQHTISGPVGNYLKYIGQTRNCSFTIVTPPDGKWGHCNGPNNCTGVIGLVARNEVDFAINPFTQTTDRKMGVDFTRPVLYDSYWGVVIPVKSKSKMWYFINPFTPELWLSYIVSIPICLIAMILIHYLCSGTFRMEATVSFLVRIVLNEHNNSDRNLGLARRYQQKLAIITMVLSFMVLTYSYSGNLTAMLTKPQLESPIRFLSELLNQTEVPWVIDSKDFVATLMSAAPPGSLTKKLYERSTKMSLMDSAGATVCYSDELKEDGTHGAICSLEDFKTLTANDFNITGKCNYYVVEQKFLQSWVALAIQVRLTCLCRLPVFHNDIT